MDNKIKVEEKLTREEIDFLKINLETCFNVIVKSNGVDGFDIENKTKFLETFSPWHKKQGKDLIKEFVNTINNPDSNNDFSWLDILDTDKQWMEPDDEETKKEIKNKSKHVNMRYQIPTHFHGDIDDAVLFYCMENPRGYINDSEMDRWVKDQMSGKLTMNDYYKQTAELRDEPWKDKTIKKIIEERYQLNDVTTDSIENSIKKIIYSDDKNESPLARELETMFKKFKNSDYKIYNFRKGSPDLKDFYYFKNYFKQLLLKDSNLKPFQQEENKNKAIEIANKICNVEIYPFSSSDPKLKGIGKTILLNSDLSRLSAYIILRRIYRYLNSPKENPKPIIVLRKYASAWEQLFVEIFKEVKEKDQSFDNRSVLSLLEKGFFYCQTGQQGGGITTGNVISVLNFKTIDKKDSKLFDDTKKKAFNSIKSVLTKAES
ncbi:hypothetical protein [Streptococcus mitis]|uniref:Uncharacterized protein n=2 Tax=Streptococcus TaxID=1301 RepID=A0A3R9KVU0_STRMT|nr:hypothetical protein [Streptococcus mitis]RSI95999.1 hypothetical protein D8843_08765 [Streptococcus mitis]